jgi:hypothetical protein
MKNRSGNFDKLSYLDKFTFFTCVIYLLPKNQQGVICTVSLDFFFCLLLCVRCLSTCTRIGNMDVIKSAPVTTHRDRKISNTRRRLPKCNLDVKRAMTALDWRKCRGSSRRSHSEKNPIWSGEIYRARPRSRTQTSFQLTSTMVGP